MVRRLLRWLRALFGERRTTSVMTLRDFFVKLLEDDNLARYYADREAYIKQQIESGLSEKDADLLLNGTLGEVEQELLAMRQSPGPQPLMIVWPPM